MQDRNAEMVQNLTQDFTRRGEFYESGARLADVMTWLNRDGGGGLMFGYPAQGIQALGAAAATGWTENSINYSNYAAVAGRGGPYVVLDGTAAADYLNITNAAWQRPVSQSLLVWFWVDVDTFLAADMTIAAQYNGVADCSWWFRINTGTLVPELVMNPTGLVAADITASSATTITASGFYFVAAHYEPGVEVTFGVAAATDGALTIDTDTPASFPATLFDAVACDLTIGAVDTAAVSQWWDGYIGVGVARVNVPATTISSHLSRIFAATKWHYGG